MYRCKTDDLILGAETMNKAIPIQCCFFKIGGKDFFKGFKFNTRH